MISNQDETKQDDTWMAAMFGGINAVIAYYEPIIINKATLYQDKSRATLNDHDLEQTCRLTIARVWEKQSSCLDIVNFDMMVKWCMDNALRSEVSREYTQKRGRCKISFFSEMETDHDGEESAGMMDRSMFKSEDAREHLTPEIDFLIQDLRSALPSDELKRTFTSIIQFYPPENLNPKNLSTGIRSHMVQLLQITDAQLIQNLENINFIFMGLRDRYMEAL